MTISCDKNIIKLEEDKNRRQDLTGLDEWAQRVYVHGQKKVEPTLCVEPMIK